MALWLKEAETKFMEAMMLLRTEKLPDGPELLDQLELDGYRAVAYKKDAKLCLRSRNNNDFTARYGMVKGRRADRFRKSPSPQLL